MLLNLQPPVYVLNAAYGSIGPNSSLFSLPHFSGRFFGISDRLIRQFSAILGKYI